VSEFSATPAGPRARRADAQRSIEAILDAAVRVLNARPEASIEDIATDAGVTRQTVYAHFTSREALISAAIERVAAQAVAAMEAADLDQGPAAAALLRFMSVGWRSFERYPLLLGTTQTDPQVDRERHEPVRRRLEQLVKRGQDVGEFDRDLSPTWLIAITIGLGHVAGAEVAAGHMTVDEAWVSLERSVQRIFGVTDLPG
jgi:AcrR family transcriptional regulator